MLSSAEYYRLTEKGYLALCPNESSYMNMGLWPAPSVESAQAALIRCFADFLLKQRGGHQPGHLLDAGSGWGGTRSVYAQMLPEASYTGVNTSTIQIEHARNLTRNIPATEYLHSTIERLSELPVPFGATLISTEAAFHFEDKAQILKDAFAKGVEDIALAEICACDPELIRSYPLLAPGLTNVWRVADYERALPEAGFTHPTVEDVSVAVFSGMADYLDTLDQQTFRGARRILAQFKASFRQMAELAAEGQLQYVFIYAKRR